MTEPCFKSPIPISSIRDFIVKNPWNVVLHLNPEIPWLDQQTCMQIGNRFLYQTQLRLYGKSENKNKKDTGIFILLPERCSRGLWHFHGLALLESSTRRNKLFRNGEHWFTEDCKRFFEIGKCKAPDYARVSKKPNSEFNSDLFSPSVKIQPVGVLNDAVRYLCKHWDFDNKEELYCISGRSH